MPIIAHSGCIFVFLDLFSIMGDYLLPEDHIMLNNKVFPRSLLDFRTFRVSLHSTHVIKSA